MNLSFRVTPIDVCFYEERIRDFLPDRLIDIHSHVWLDRHRRPRTGEQRRIASWPDRVARENSIEDLLETYRLMLPGKHVTPMVFSNLGPGDDLDAANAYVGSSARSHDFPALLFATPAWNAKEFERRIGAGGFLGAKVYLTFADPKIPADEIQVFDFLPHHQLEVLDEHGWLAMLHLPRPGRLKDPVNLAQILEIEKRYPHLTLIVAHVGRAYCPSDTGNAFEVLAATQQVMFDISANTCTDTFRALIRSVGVKRILFGSDLPILQMRTRRICESETYVNLVPKGLYGDVSGDPHLREVESPEADQLTFLLYEEIDAFRSAAESTGLSRDDVKACFYGNALRILNKAGLCSGI